MMVCFQSMLRSLCLSIFFLSFLSVVCLFILLNLCKPRKKSGAKPTSHLAPTSNEHQQYSVEVPEQPLFSWVIGSFSWICSLDHLCAFGLQSDSAYQCFRRKVLADDLFICEASILFCHVVFPLRNSQPPGPSYCVSDHFRLLAARFPPSVNPKICVVRYSVASSLVLLVVRECGIRRFEVLQNRMQETVGHWSVFFLNTSPSG